MDDLTIQDGPKDPEDGLRAIGVVLDVAVLGPIKVREYSRLRTLLESIGYRLGENYVEFAYDWRQSNFTTARQFAAFVNSNPILKGRDFDIVAHSMGGLVAEIYTKELDQGRRVRRVVNMAVPFLGSAATLDTLQSGWGNPANWAAGGMTSIRRFLLSLPSFYELLPRYRFCCILGRASEANRTPYDPLSKRTWRLLDWGVDGAADPEDAHLEASLQRAEQLRDLAARPYPNYVQTYSLVGSSIDTPWQYYVDTASRSVTSFNSGVGDGTVPAGSAANNDLPGAFVSMAQHGRIFDDLSGSETIKRILGGGVGLPIAYNAKSYATSTKDGTTIQVRSVGLNVGPSLVDPGTPIEIGLRLSGDEGAPLDAVPVTGSVQDPAGVVIPLSFKALSSGSATASYVSTFEAGNVSGPMNVSVSVPGLPTLYDSVIVRER